MLGLPFPNPTDMELKEHMRYLDGLSAISPDSCEAKKLPVPQQTGGQQYYEELCMKAVNQCIGRVIRHQNDWAAVLVAGTFALASPYITSDATTERIPAGVLLAAPSSFSVDSPG